MMQLGRLWARGHIGRTKIQYSKWARRVVTHQEEEILLTKMMRLREAMAASLQVVFNLERNYYYYYYFVKKIIHK